MNATATVPGEVTGIVQAMYPAGDLAASAAWFRDLLGLVYLREFERDGRITGCALYDPHAGYLISLRLRETLPGEAHLRGEHPVIVGVPDRATLARIAGRAAALGYEPVTGEHGDAAWVEVVDPDGTCLRFAYVTGDPSGFVGVRFGADGTITEYGEPRLRLPESRVPE
jgi:catechol 2,3-dioxygenase-like lactoylglutathione lyase family enzyme